MANVRITHTESGVVLADGPKGWGITPFEGNLYIGRKHLRTNRFKVNFLPGLCFYKFLYVWLDLRLEGGRRVRNLGWMYWMPNPLFHSSGFGWRCRASTPNSRSKSTDRHPHPVQSLPDAGPG